MRYLCEVRSQGQVVVGSIRKTTVLISPNLYHISPGKLRGTNIRVLARIKGTYSGIENYIASTQDR